MEKTLLYNELYDYYKRLFTKKQQDCFEYYYFDNLSLGEIAEILKITRNAVHNQIQRVEEKLLDYEEKLMMKSRREKLLKKIEDKLDDGTIEEIKEIL